MFVRFDEIAMHDATTELSMLYLTFLVTHVPGWWKLGESSLAIALAISDSCRAAELAWSAVSPFARACAVLSREKK